MGKYFRKEYPFNEGQCQKVFNKKISDNPRKYTVPARGSDSHYELYKNEPPSNSSMPT